MHGQGLKVVIGHQRPLRETMMELNGVKTNEKESIIPNTVIGLGMSYGTDFMSKELKESGNKPIGEGLKIMSDVMTDLTQDGIQNAAEE